MGQSQINSSTTNHYEKKKAKGSLCLIPFNTLEVGLPLTRTNIEVEKTQLTQFLHFSQNQRQTNLYLRKLHVTKLYVDRTMTSVLD